MEMLRKWIRSFRKTQQRVDDLEQYVELLKLGSCKKRTVTKDGEDVGIAYCFHNHCDIYFFEHAQPGNACLLNVTSLRPFGLEFKSDGGPRLQVEL